MKILMTNNSLDRRGGSESYLEVASAELRRLGHEIVLFSGHLGETADRLRHSGFDVHDRLADLPRDVDVIHGQHTNVIALVRERLPTVPLAFACHSWLISIEDPVSALGAGAYVVFNDVTRRRLAAHSATTGTDIIRLRQPVEVTFADALREPINEAPRRAVAVSRSMRLLPQRLERACAASGIAFEWVGAEHTQSTDPRREMRAADIVFAVGRTALEAMVDARAVLVIDESMRGGWVTDASYASLEADGFTGRYASAVDDVEVLLAQYSRDLGGQARFLACQHHAAQHHAADLVEVYSSVADLPATAVAPSSLGPLLQDRFALQHRAVEAEWEAARLRTELSDVRAELDGRLAEREHLLARLEGLRDRLRRARTRARRFRRQRDRARGLAESRQPPTKPWSR